LEDLALLIIKNHLPTQFVENAWLKRFEMHLCPRLLFPSRKQFFQKNFAWIGASRNMFYQVF
jgi:hypothetical protein